MNINGYVPFLIYMLETIVTERERGVAQYVD